MSPLSLNRDLLGETTAEARRQNLKVIARVDFSKAREDVFKDHPEWFRRNATGKLDVEDEREYAPGARGEAVAGQMRRTTGTTEPARWAAIAMKGSRSRSFRRCRSSTRWTVST